MKPQPSVIISLMLILACQPPQAWGWQDSFPTPRNSEKNPGEPMSAVEAARTFDARGGLTVQVFASEPLIRNPIGAAFDGEGHLWVAENYTYAERELRFDPRHRDRVVVLSDGNRDGVADQATVFLDNLQTLTSVEVGLGGVWLLCPPRLLFVPDANGDLKPDSAPQVVLDGFHVPMESHHNLANGLKWGPDGWLYGRCGASAFTRVHRPGQPATEAIPLAGGIWRYHPQRKVFEPVCHGTTNPWGHDWDALGECFFVNTVNGHLWHMIAGGHCRRPHTVSPNSLVYEPLEMIADHWHFDTGKGWTSSRDAKGGSDALGGGHAHSGALVYKGGLWPKEYQGKLLTLNFHGRRVNVEKLEREGSGFVGKHQPDILKSADPFFRGIDLLEGPDGAVYLLDWSDTGECHDSTGVHRTSGRIFRVGAPGPQPPVNTGGLVAEALGAQGEWKARMARIRLGGMDQPPDISVEFLAPTNPPGKRLKALWALHTLGKTTPAMLLPLLSDAEETLRAWAIRLLLDCCTLDTVEGHSRMESTQVAPEILDALVAQGEKEKSAMVRLALASSLGRLPTKDRARLARALLRHREDAKDANLSKVIWYGLIPVALKNPAALPDLALISELPQVRVWIARALAEKVPSQPEPLDQLLLGGSGSPETVRRDLVLGIAAGLAGIRRVQAPGSWGRFNKEFTGQEKVELGNQVRQIDIVFGDGRALEEVQATALDAKADMNSRRLALATLIDAGPDNLRQVCEKLLSVRSLNALALEGLTRFEDPDLGKRVIAQWSSFYPIDRPAAVRALASRPKLADALLDGVESGKIPRDLLNAGLARQIRSFQDPNLNAKVDRVWGTLRDSPLDKKKKMDQIRAAATPNALKQADPRRGRLVYTKACATCHRLFGEGGDIGPDLTGTGRKDLDYLISNLVDPGAVLASNYRVSVVELKDGRLFAGIVQGKTDQFIALQTDKEKRVIPLMDIEGIRQTGQSLMPDGLMDQLQPGEILDLFAYLIADQQVPPGVGVPQPPGSVGR